MLNNRAPYEKYGRPLPAHTGHSVPACSGPPQRAQLDPERATRAGPPGTAGMVPRRLSPRRARRAPAGSLVHSKGSGLGTPGAAHPRARPPARRPGAPAGARRGPRPRPRPPSARQWCGAAGCRGGPRPRPPPWPARRRGRLAARVAAEPGRLRRDSAPKRVPRGNSFPGDTFAPAHGWANSDTCRFLVKRLCGGPAAWRMWRTMHAAVV